METVREGIKKTGFTKKLVQNQLVWVNTVHVKDARAIYTREFNQMIIPAQRRIFIDESGFNLFMRKKHGYAPLEETALHWVTANRAINVSLICAVTCEEVVHYKIKVGSVKSTNFKEFLTEMKTKIEIVYGTDNNYMLILDNARIHYLLET